jgi:hypothetical protein
MAAHPQSPPKISVRLEHFASEPSTVFLLAPLVALGVKKVGLHSNKRCRRSSNLHRPWPFRCPSARADLRASRQSHAQPR